MFKVIKFFTFLYSLGFVKGHAFLDWDPPNNAFNQDFYKKVLDPELCQTQLNYIRRNNTFLLAQCKF